MALPKESRILFSKKIVVAPDELVGIDASVASLENTKDAIQSLDDAHKALFAPVNNVITGYHGELSYYSTILRTSMTEQNLIDAANFTLDNFLYPRNPAAPPPSIAPSVWVKTKPYARNIASGMTFAEVFPAPSQTSIPTLLATAANDLAAIRFSYSNIARATGLKCDTSPLDPPIADTDLQDAATDAHALVMSAVPLLSSLNFALLSIPEYDPTRAAAINALSGTIINAINQISVWDALPNFSSMSFLTCAAFNAYNPNLLPASKYREAELAPIATLIGNLASTLSTRQTYVETLLGSITQNLSTADVTGTGLYLERWNLLGLRLNLLGGSLIELYSIMRAIDSQIERKGNITANKDFYSTKLFATKLAAPSNGTNYVHVRDASGFAPGDLIYICSDTQDELPFGVESIVGNTLYLGTSVPSKYRDNEYGRVYKEV